MYKDRSARQREQTSGSGRQPGVLPLSANVRPNMRLLSNKKRAAHLGWPAGLPAVAQDSSALRLEYT